MSMIFLTPDQVAKARSYNYPIYVCPNENKPILGELNGDDKVLCACGKGNPNAPEGVQRVERDTRVHLIQYLTKYQGD